jgi:hypothetical protein
MTKRLAVIALTLLTLTGCSQVAALAPVGGDGITMVRFAANDILVQQKVDVLVAPACTQAGTDITCTGTTITGEPITVASTDTDNAELTVTVGGRTIYTGSVQDVLDAGARPTP